MEGFININLDSVCDGAAHELFKRELEAVLANIGDANTHPTTNRKIMMEFVISPDTTRESGKITLKCKSSLASVNEVANPIFFGKNGTKRAAYHRAQQEGINFLLKIAGDAQ